MPVDPELRNALQARVVTRAVQSLRAGRNVLITAPTGMGKTRMFTNVLRDAIGDGPGEVLVIQDRIKVAEQNLAANPDERTSLAIDGNFDQSGTFVYATAQTAAKFTSDFKPYRYLCIDECQHASAEEQSLNARIIAAALAANPDLQIVAASATPDRTDSLGLHPEIARADVFKITYEEAIRSAAIVEPQTRVPYWSLSDGRTVEDLVNNATGRLDPTQRHGALETEMRRKRPIDYHDQCVRAWLRYGEDQPTFAYAGTIKDCDSLRLSFREHDIEARTIHSGMKAKDIRQASEDYRSGRTKVLVSVDMLIEGVDEPRTACILNAKEVTTSRDHIQIVGRGLRAHDGKTKCVNIDMGASTALHGRIETLIAIEAFAYDGYKASGYRPWKDVSEEPHVMALHLGDRTMFAARLDQQNYLVLEKSEIRLGLTKDDKARIRLSDWKETANLIELATFAQDSVRANLPLFNALESRRETIGDNPPNSRMNNILNASFKDSAGSILAHWRLRNDPAARTVQNAVATQQRRAAGSER